MKNSIKTILSIIIAITSLNIFSSCDKGDYSPISTSTEGCRIMVRCVDRRGDNLLDDTKFVDGIRIEGEASHSVISYEIRNSGNEKYLCFNAELPDQGDMKWTYDRREATGISKMTIKFKKQKVQLRCLIKYIANRPPIASGGTATLEEVECNHQTYKRSENAVTITLKMDENGHLL